MSFSYRDHVWDRLSLVLVLLVAVLLIGPSSAKSQTYIIGNYVAGSGEGKIADGSYEITGTVGQPLVGTVQDGNYVVGSGAWHVSSGIMWTEVNQGPDETKSLPMVFALRQNYPNPFNPATQINFSVPKNSHVSLKVYNVLGQEVEVLADDQFAAGEHSVQFDASGLSSGIYFYRMEAGSFEETRKLVLIK